MGKSRILNGIAVSIAQKFAASANHFAWLAKQKDIEDVAINLMNGTIIPATFENPRNETLVRYCVQTFHRLLETQYAQPIYSAVLSIHFDLTDEKMRGIFNVSIQLADGREFSRGIQEYVIPQP